jgi:hypothetical protein
VGSDISLLGGCSEGGELLNEPVGHLLDFVNVPVNKLMDDSCAEASLLDVTRDTVSQLGPLWQFGELTKGSRQPLSIYRYNPADAPRHIVRIWGWQRASS